MSISVSASTTPCASSPSARAIASTVGSQSPFAGLALEELFAPHADGRHDVCRVCKRMVSPSCAARAFHMEEFHRVRVPASR